MLQALSVAAGQMRDDSRQRTAAARIHFADQTSTQPARIEQTHSQTYTVRTDRKESKRTVQPNRSFKQPNPPKFVSPPPSSATDFSTIKHPIKSNDISNEIRKLRQLSL